MRTRLLAVMAAALLSLPALSAAAGLSPADHGCDAPVSVDKKCEGTRG